MYMVFDHAFGLQSQAEVYHFGATLLGVEPHEHNEALAHGWLITTNHGQPKWYQSRSTRCNLEHTDYTMLSADQAQILQDPLPLVEIDHIYSAYCYYKRYKKYFEVGEQLEWDQFMGYYDQDHNLQAWSKLRRYSTEAIETVVFAWDYRNPEQHLGIKTLEHELAWAKSQGYRYVYMGPGYERMNRYKADVVGFEWWTGSEWSTDRDQYRALCERDNKIKSVEDLHGIQTAL